MLPQVPPRWDAPPKESTAHLRRCPGCTPAGGPPPPCRSRCRARVPWGQGDQWWEHKVSLCRHAATAHSDPRWQGTPAVAPIPDKKSHPNKQTTAKRQSTRQKKETQEAAAPSTQTTTSRQGQQQAGIHPPVLLEHHMHHVADRHHACHAVGITDLTKKKTKKDRGRGQTRPTTATKGGLGQETSRPARWGSPQNRPPGRLAQWDWRHPPGSTCHRPVQEVCAPSASSTPPRHPPTHPTDNPPTAHPMNLQTA